MGLDTSHDCWHGPYSAYGRWRNALAQAAGYGLVKTGPYKIEVPDLPYERFTLANAAGDWGTVPEDPLLYLLVHSDCDGAIHPEQGRALATRLGELLPKLDPEREYNYVAEKTVQFIVYYRE